MTQLTCRFLGPPQVEVEGVSLRVPLNKSLALLAYLAVVQKPVLREALALLLWPNLDPVRSRKALRQTLWVLNKSGLRSCLAVAHGTVGLQTGALRVDLVEFQRKLRAADAEKEDIKRLDLLWEAVTLYRGDFLEGFTLSDSRAFDDWQLFESATLEAKACRAFSRLTAALTRRGDYKQALDAVHLWLARDPYSEPAHRRLMRLYSWTGRRADAVRRHRLFERRLEEEIGATPEPKTGELFQVLRSGRVPPEPEAAPQSAATGLDVDRASGMRAGTRWPAESNPLWGVSDACPAPLIGREQELKAITERLLNPACRLLVLTGIGGVGKTSLAAHAAERVAEHFKHGYYFVSLQSTRSSEGLMAAIASRLGIALDGMIDGEKQLALCIRSRNLLLVLDNFEQLIESAVLLREWLAVCPKLTLLVTSRQPLQLPGEWLFEVGGLGIPAHNSPEDLQRSDAVRLLLESARQSGNDFTPEQMVKEGRHLVRICRRAGGLPLALKLAAVWLRVLSLREVAEELGGTVNLAVDNPSLPERHRSLNALFETTWRSLSSRELSAIERLSVFKRTFSRQAAAEAAGVELSTLMALRSKSLLDRAGEGQFAIHPLIRRYACKRLQRRPLARDEIRQTFIGYYVRLLERAGEEIKGAAQHQILELMNRELDNLHATWDALVRAGNGEAIDNGVECLYRYHLIRGSYLRAERLLSAAYGALRRRRADGNCQAKVAIRLSRIYALQGKIDLAELLLRRHLECIRRSGQSRELALALSYRGLVEIERGAFREAETYLQEGLKVSRAVRDSHSEAGCLLKLGRLAGQTGAHAQALEFLTESLALFGYLGDQSKIGSCYHNMGTVLATSGRSFEAEKYYQEALRVARDLGHDQNTTLALGNLGLLYLRAGRVDRARKSLLKSLHLAERVGCLQIYARCLTLFGSLYLTQKDLDRAKSCFHNALELSWQNGFGAVTLDVLANFAQVLMQAGRRRNALQLAGFAVRHESSEYETRRLAESVLKRKSDEREQGDRGARSETTLEVLVRKVLDDPFLQSTVRLRLSKPASDSRGFQALG